MSSPRLQLGDSSILNKNVRLVISAINIVDIYITFTAHLKVCDISYRLGCLFCCLCVKSGYGLYILHGDEVCCKHVLETPFAIGQKAFIVENCLKLQTIKNKFREKLYTYT